MRRAWAAGVGAAGVGLERSEAFSVAPWEGEEEEFRRRRRN
jgi:hypothetical protein